ncbi:hypothetical protein T265_13997 [Opisthorchis viverrini]|uniref:Uracil-DNA glycosylase-like domain-containing protein n=1 Tax=Opisthorchis viverrini TaxID=6198 RepID=A0A074ZGJ2_OPIVI|nr:hypothetical protein T265_13997 [Opisthorchis viverrini]KER26406.1 hypothetical protein T265_13997 [Opisthorchis viverrini]
MPKLPYVNQKPLTAFFTSPKAVAKLPDAKENSITPASPAETPKSARTPEKRALEEICPSNTNGQPNVDDDVESTKRPRVESDTAQQIKSPPPSAWGSFPLGKSSTSALGREDLNKKLAEIKRKLASRPTRSVLTLIQGLHPEWACVLQQQIESERFQKLADFVAGERARPTAVYPPCEQVFTWSQLCPPSSVRVVILGQDPYHGPKQAHGLAFSVQRPLPPPPSLINMYKEIRSGLPESAGNLEWSPKHGDLSGWARQGVLLLNAVLTVRASSPNSHKDQGWELLTDAVIRHLSKDKSVSTGDKTQGDYGNIRQRMNSLRDMDKEPTCPLRIQPSRTKILMKTSPKVVTVSAESAVCLSKATVRPTPFDLPSFCVGTIPWRTSFQSVEASGFATGL